MSVDLLDSLKKDRQTSDTMTELVSVLNREDSQASFSDVSSYECTFIDEGGINTNDADCRARISNNVRNGKVKLLVKEVDIHYVKVLLYVGQATYHGILLLFFVMYNFSNGKNEFIILQHCLLMASWVLLVLVETMRHSLPGKVEVLSFSAYSQPLSW